MVKTTPAEPDDNTKTETSAVTPETAPTAPLAAEQPEPAPVAHGANPAPGAGLPPHPGVAAEPVAASAYSKKRPRGLVLGAVIGGAALTAGLVFGGGVALGLALPDGHGDGFARIAPGGAPGDHDARSEGPGMRGEFGDRGGSDRGRP